MKTYYIGADVDGKMTNFAVEYQGRIVRECVVPTTVSAWRAVLSEIDGRRRVVMEEGTLAGWLYRSLKDQVEAFVVCDPRRNRLICGDGDKTDRVDARKLAALYRGGYVRAVYHSEDVERVALKEWVSLYEDRVKAAVREGHKLRDRCRLYGVRLTRSVRTNSAKREVFFASLAEPLKGQAAVLLSGYERMCEQVRWAKSELLKRSKSYAEIERFQALPGVGVIRAVTFFSILETPYRFKTCKQLWKYCGVGLQRSSSGKDASGVMKPGRLQLAWAVNRRLKSVVMGMALSAIRQRGNVFWEYYRRRISDGMSSSNARHSVARKMVSVMWGMWKNKSRYHECWVSDGSCRA